MNERIRELIKSLGIIPEDEHYEVAELLIRECMKVIIDDMDSNPDDEAFNDALDHAQSIIGEHFGVKE